ncbi:MAG TPA: preprotein translocase subunit SecE [Clostridiales bacterium]|jgi:preprotein translocase subunit SecE|nr:preprotein translocase subunit SecE [Clostridiales bacterium]
MGDVTNTTTEKAPKRSWFSGLKTEFNKIVWPNKEDLMKQSVAVVIATVILGAVIFALDALIELGIGVILG